MQSRKMKMQELTKAVSKKHTLEEYGLQTLIDKVVTHLLDHHVALTRSHRLLIDTENQSLACFLHSYTPRPLQWMATVKDKGGEL